MEDPTIEEDSNMLTTIAYDATLTLSDISIVERVQQILEDVVVSKRLIKEATDGVSEECGIREAVALIISQRDNAYNEAEHYKKEMFKYKYALEELT